MLWIAVGVAVGVSKRTILADYAGTAELTKTEERFRYDMESVCNWNLLVDVRTGFPTILGAKKSQDAG